MRRRVERGHDARDETEAARRRHEQTYQVLLRPAAMRARERQTNARSDERGRARRREMTR